MTTISEIAKDPRKALKDLEKDLGVGEGTLLREMQQLADEIGDWAQHIPYTVAARYYDSRKAQALYQPHVDECAHCQRMLESLHPTELQSAAFVREAVRAQAQKAPRRVRAAWLPVTAVASMLVTGLPSLLILPQLPLVAARTPSHDVTTLAHELRTQPSTLVRLEKSDEPRDRYEAARLYFTADKPQLAWQQIGQGLELAGVHSVDAQKITTAADVPTDKPAQTLVKAAERLPTLESGASGEHPTVYLEKAEVQAKLGLNTDALKSVQQYLKATHADSKTLADFSNTALARPSKLDGRFGTPTMAEAAK